MKFKKIFQVTMVAFIILFSGNSKIVQAEGVKNDMVDYRIVENDKVWNIEFTEILDLSTVNENSVFITDFENNKVLGIEITIKDGRRISLSKDTVYKSGEFYTLHIEDSILNIDGENLKEGRDLNFKVGQSSYEGFNVEEIEQIDKNRILIKFTEEIDSKAEVALFYKMKNDNGDIIEGSYENFEISLVEGAPKFLLVEVTNKDFEMDGNSFLKISGQLKSVDSVRFNSGQDEWFVVQRPEGFEKFRIESASLVGDKVLSVKFNKIINKKDSEKEINFKVLDNSGSSIGVEKARYYNEKEVRLNLKKKIEEFGEYKVQVKNMSDFTESMHIHNKYLNFEVDEITETKLNYTAKTIDKRTVELIFDQKVEAFSAKRSSNYILSLKGDSNNGQIPKDIYFDEITGDRVKLFFYNDLKYKGGYRLRVMRTLENTFGEVFDVDSIKEIDYSNKDYTFELDSANRGDKYIDLIFSNEIEVTDNTMDKKYYELQLDEGDGRKITIECNEVQMINGKTLRIRFEGIRENEEYTLYPPSIKGFFGDQILFGGGIDI